MGARGRTEDGMRRWLDRFLRLFFTCRVLGHWWVVGCWGIPAGWDYKTWRCRYCPMWSRVERAEQDPDTGRLALGER